MDDLKWRVVDDEPGDGGFVREGRQGALGQDGGGSEIEAGVDDMAEVTGFAVENDESVALNGGVDAVFSEGNGGDEGFFLNDILPDGLAGVALEAEDARLRGEVEAVLERANGADSEDVALPEGLSVVRIEGV